MWTSFIFIGGFVLLIPIVFGFIGKTKAEAVFKQMKKNLDRKPHLERHFTRALSTLGFELYHVENVLRKDGDGRLDIYPGQYFFTSKGILACDEENKVWIFPESSWFLRKFLNKKAGTLLEECELQNAVQRTNDPNSYVT